MKKTIFIYGLLASAIIAGVSALFLWTASEDPDYSSSAWLGYVVMIVGFTMVFIGIKQQRDKHQGGIISFVEAFKVGISITLIATFFYVVSWELYYQNAGQDFMEKYSASYIDNMRQNGADEAAIAATQKEMQTMGEKYKQFPFRFFITLMEIFPVGLLVTLISAWLLKTRKT